MSNSNRQRLLTVAVLLAISLTALAQKGNMETIADAYHLSAYLVAALMISIFVMVFSNRLFYFRQDQVSTQAQQLNKQLGLVLTSNKTHIWTYDFSKHLYTLLSRNGEEEQSYAPIDFSQFFDKNEFTQLHKTITSMTDSPDEPKPIVIKGCTCLPVMRWVDVEFAVKHVCRRIGHVIRREKIMFFRFHCF